MAGMTSDSTCTTARNHSVRKLRSRPWLARYSLSACSSPAENADQSPGSSRRNVSTMSSTVTSTTAATTSIASRFSLLLASSDMK